MAFTSAAASPLAGESPAAISTYETIFDAADHGNVYAMQFKCDTTSVTLELTGGDRDSCLKGPLESFVIAGEDWHTLYVKPHGFTKIRAKATATNAVLYWRPVVA